MKIEEMAEAYGRNNPFTWVDADSVLNDDTNSPAIAFEAGAKAVLNEIEDIVNLPIMDDSDIVALLMDKIQEFKGEQL